MLYYAMLCCVDLNLNKLMAYEKGKEKGVG